MRQTEENMDSDISGWVLEFLLRSSVPDSTIQKTLAALPLSGADPRLKKTLLLRALHSHLINASLSETALEILELLEQIHLNDAVPVPDSLRRAFCAVAVECTVKYLAASPDDPSGEYFSAIRRIWRGRVTALTEECRPSGLVCDELMRWRDDIEAALWDPRVSERIAGLNTRWVAMVEVRGYLKEAWKNMGASFLELMATGSKLKGKGLRLEGVCENDSVRKRGDDGGAECSAKPADRVEFDDNDANGTDDGACHMEGVTVTDENQGKDQFEDTVDVPAKGNQVQKEKGVQISGVCENDSVRKRGDGGLECSTKRADRIEFDDNDANVNDDGACHMEGVTVTDENQGKELFEDTVDVAKGNQVQKENIQLKGKQFVLQKRHKGVQISGVCENDSVRKGGDGGLECSAKHADTDRIEFDDNDANGNDDGACHMEGVTVTGENQGKVQFEDTADVPAKGNQVQKENIQLKRKQSVLQKCHKGVQISGVCENDSVRKRGDGGLECLAKRADRIEFDDNDANVTDDGACHMEGVTVKDENKGKEQFEDTVDVPAKGNQVKKENIQLKRKQSVLQKCPKGVKISGAEEVEPKKSRSNYDPLPSAEVKNVRESLRSSSLELRAVVTDPLPDALHTSQVVRSKLPMKDTKLEPEPHIIENQSGGVHLPGPDACRSIVPFLPNNGDLRNKSSVHCSNGDRPNLMEQRSTAQTVDSLPRGTQPKRKKMRWTLLEEETLRAGVKLFGEGNWKEIRSFYSKIFENRTAVDLKDKWRNMLR